MENNSTKLPLSSSDFATAVRVIEEVKRCQSYSDEVKLGDFQYALAVQMFALKENEDAIGGYLAAVIQADEQDTKKPQPNYGRFRPSLEGTPEWEFSKLQREDNAVNFSND
jgi:hypothetical protein